MIWQTLYAYDYSEDEWNADLNFWLQCCRVYMSLKDTGIKPQPPMANMTIRHLKASMGANFEDWAEGYFSPESGHLDTYLARDDVLMSIRDFQTSAALPCRRLLSASRRFVSSARGLTALILQSYATQVVAYRELCK